ncbi:MAG: class I mannose-6-phosphate isomerase [Clostridia bacterium]|nr:class I mannose-6-phosphate isomerase [Clostridia bacterium]
MNFYPMKLSSVPKNIIWGGVKLRELYNKKSEFEKIAESWELTVRDDGMSYIENGCYMGMSLREFTDKYPAAVGESFRGGSFPLLIKFIDAEKDLSVQVHPGDSYARIHENSSGKTEMWYVVHAEDGASLIYGLSESVTEADFAKAINGTISAELFTKIPIKTGDVFFIPPGQIHAICKGTLIAEIQQNSNITYRIYDYDRLDSDGKPRELHREKAVDVVKKYTPEEIKELSFSGNPNRRASVASGKILCDCEYFRVTHLNNDGELVFTVDEQSFVSLLFTHAENAVVSCNGVCLSVSAGDSLFIPAGCADVTLSGRSELLISEM